MGLVIIFEYACKLLRNFRCTYIIYRAVERSLLLFLAALLLLGVATAVFAGGRGLDGGSTLVVASDEASEVLVFLPLIVHSATAKGKRSNELLEGERALLKTLETELGEDVLASLLDGACRVTFGDVSKGRQLEVCLDLASCLLDEDLPH